MPLKGPGVLSQTFNLATGVVETFQTGYFGGGPGPSSSVDRIDFSNDTATASSKGPLSASRYGLAASSAAANGLPQ